MERDEEMRLARLARGGDRRATELLLKENLKYVVSIAYSLKRYKVALEDLISEGNLGLMESVGRFDPERGVRFITYASWWVRAFMFDFILDSRSMVGIKGSVKNGVFFSLAKERAKIEAHTTDPSEVEAQLAGVFGISPARLARMKELLEIRVLSMDTPILERDQDGHTRTYGESLASTTPSPEEDAAELESMLHSKMLVREALGTLTPREARIVELRLMAEEPRTLAEIGLELDVSRERVRQLEEKAIGKLKMTIRAA